MFVRPIAGDRVPSGRRGCLEELPRVAWLAGPGERRDRPRRIDAAHDVVVRVGHVDVPLGVRRHGSDLARKPGQGSEPAVRSVEGLPCPGERRDAARGIDPADPVIRQLGDVEIAALLKRLHLANARRAYHELIERAKR